MGVALLLGLLLWPLSLIAFGALAGWLAGLGASLILGRKTGSARIDAFLGVAGNVFVHIVAVVYNDSGPLTFNQWWWTAIAAAAVLPVAWRTQSRLAPRD